jgi:hypothetical protein
MAPPGEDAIEKAMVGALSREEQLAAIESAARRYYAPEQEFDDRNKLMAVEEMSRWIEPGRILERGYRNDIWTTALLKHGTVDVIEAASNHVERAQDDLADDGRVSIHDVPFGEYEPWERYDTVLMAWVVKHVSDDVELLRRARSWLRPRGIVIGCTPNGRSFHRRHGALMGLELSPETPNERDREIFNVHLYDRYSWRAAFLRAVYEVTVNKGTFLKPLSTKQLMQLSSEFDVERMQGLRQLGEELRDDAWYLMVVARCRPADA